MPARLRITIIGFGLAFFLGLTAWLAVGAPGSAPSSSVDSTGWAGALRPDIPPQALDGLKDQDGQPAKLGGDVTIVTFLYTSCEDTCPTTAQQIRGALDRLGKDAPRTIAISVDPKGDTPKTAKAFLADQDLSGRMDYLLGPPVALQRQWTIYGIQPQTKDLEHSASVVLLDRTGKQRIGFPVDKLTPEGLAADVQKLRATS